MKVGQRVRAVCEIDQADLEGRLGVIRWNSGAEYLVEFDEPFYNLYSRNRVGHSGNIVDGSLNCWWVMDSDIVAAEVETVKSILNYYESDI